MKTIEITDGLTAQYSPMNQAYFIMFMNQQVLAILSQVSVMQSVGYSAVSFHQKRNLHMKMILKSKNVALKWRK